MPGITNNPQPIFPDLPRESPIVDKNGQLTALWSLGLSSLFQALQSNYKNEGILIPPLTTTQANQILAIYTPLIGSPLPLNVPDISGQMIYNSTISTPQMFVITYSGNNIATVAWRTFVFV